MASADSTYPSTLEARSASLLEIESGTQLYSQRSTLVSAETLDILRSNEALAKEVELLKQTFADKPKPDDLASVRLESRLLERNLNTIQRDTNLLETKLKKIHRACKTTDMEFNAMLTAIGQLSSRNDALQSLVDEDLSCLTPEALQLAYETIQTQLFQKLVSIDPLYVYQSAITTIHLWMSYSQIDFVFSPTFL